MAHCGQLQVHVLARDDLGDRAEQCAVLFDGRLQHAAEVRADVEPEPATLVTAGLGHRFAVQVRDPDVARERSAGETGQVAGDAPARQHDIVAPFAVRHVHSSTQCRTQVACMVQILIIHLMNDYHSRRE